jgi:PAS domain S-box-containing protein
VFQSGKSCKYEARLGKDDGTEVYYENSVGPIKHDGQIVSAILITNDISERKQAEEALRASESRFKSIITSMVDLVFTFDEKARFTFCSAPSHELYIQQNKFLGKKHSEVMPPDVNKKFMEAFNSNRKGKPAEYEYALKIGGKANWYSVKSNPIIVDGRFRGEVAVVRNITERKKIEESLIQRSHDLGERVKELRCLYGLEALTREERLTIDEVFEKTVRLIPPAWQYPEITGCRITFEGKKYRTSNFKSSKWMQKEDINLNGKKAGTVEVCYLKQKPECDEGPFLKEERKLLSSISYRLGEFIEHKQEQEQIYFQASLLKQVREAVIVTDLTGKVIFWNRHAGKLYQWKKEEALGKNIGELNVPPEEKSRAKEILKIVESKGYWEGEFIVRRKDGSQFPAYVVDTVIKDSSDKKVGIIGLSVDITERKQTEEAYQTLVDKSIQGITVLQDGRLVFVNLRVAEITGYTAEELLAMSPGEIRDMVHPEDRAMVTSRWRDREAGKQVPQRYEYRIIRKDGETRWLEIYSNVISYKGRKAVQTTTLDITDRKKAEEGIKFLSKVVETSPISIIATGLEGRILYVNSATEKLFGYRRAELLGKNPIVLNAESNAEEIQKEIFDTIKRGKIWKGEILNRKKNGDLKLEN